jgi:hypothetical protein
VRLTTAVFVMALLFISSVSFAWDDCPFGLVNDTYPGDCGRYIDASGDLICDHSQSDPGSLAPIVNSSYVAEEGSGLEKIANLTGIPATQLTLGQIADFYKVDRSLFVSKVKENFNLSTLSPDDLLLPIHDNYGVCADELVLIATQISGNALNGGEVEYAGPQIKAMSVSQVAGAYGISEQVFISALETEYGLNSITGSDLFQTLHDNYGVTPARVKEIAASLKEGVSQGSQTAAPVLQNASSAPLSKSSKPSQPLTYDYAWLTALILLAYAATYYAAYIKKISVFLHRKIWNALLFAFTLAVALTGIYLVIRVNWGVYIEFPFNVLQVHVATGIAFAIIALFHAAWHIPYFKGYLPKEKEPIPAQAKKA